MSYIRTKRIKGGIYYYLVKSVREGRRVYQVNLAYIGAVKPSKEAVRKLKKKYDRAT
ncbi:MAG: hypothetical protein JW778_02315 [Candidatus Altiarchaeota archaeon]|nr:hypothetical protein [Candidatus Altiarchaeota archaeon]